MGADERDDRVAEYGEEYDTKRFLRGAAGLLLAPLDSLIGLGKSAYYFAKSPKDYFYNFNDDIKDKTARRLPWTVNLSRVGALLFTAAAITSVIVFPPLGGVLGIVGIVAAIYGSAWIGRFAGALLGGIIDHRAIRSRINKIETKSDNNVEYLKPKDGVDHQNNVDIKNNRKQEKLQKIKNTSTLTITGKLLRNAIAEGLCSEAGLERALRPPKQPEQRFTFDEPDFSPTTNSQEPSEPSQYLDDGHPAEKKSKKPDPYKEEASKRFHDEEVFKDALPTDSHSRKMRMGG